MAKASKRELLLLKKMVKTFSVGMRQGMLDGAEKGMEDQYRMQKKKGEIPTKESIIKEITENQEFLIICADAKITLQDFKDMADRVIAREESM
jgi:hypothetical protein